MKNVYLSDLVSFYKRNLGFEDFYNRVYARIGERGFISTKRCLHGLMEQKDVEATKIANFFIDTKPLRVDVPVWFGDSQKSRIKILVYGREPRDTDECFDIEQIGNRIYAAPFGCDRWNEETTIKRKPQLKYFRVFKEFIENECIFWIFSDIVKKYYIKGNKRQNDEEASRKFREFAIQSDNIKFLKEERRLIKPTKIFLLGKDAFNFYIKNLNKRDCEHIRHPSHGGEERAISAIKKILSLLFEKLKADR